MAQDCFRSSIVSPAPFMGNHGELVKLSNGSLWEIQNEYSYLYEYHPNVIVCPSQGILLVGDKRKLAARQLASGSLGPQVKVVETFIESNFNGLQMGNIYKLSHGEIWEQTEAWTWAWSWARPKALIYADGKITRMKVENIDHAVMVRRLR